SQQAQTLAAVVGQSGSDDIDLPAELGTTSTQQVVAVDGAVLAYSPDLRSHAPLVRVHPALGHAAYSRAVLGPDADYRVVAVGAGRGVAPRWHPEPDARPPGERRASSASVRLRRQPRAAQPAGCAENRRRGGHGAPRLRGVADDGRGASRGGAAGRATRCRSA